MQGLVTRNKESCEDSPPVPLAAVACRMPQHAAAALSGPGHLGFQFLPEPT